MFWLLKLAKATEKSVSPELQFPATGPYPGEEFSAQHPAIQPHRHPKGRTVGGS